MLVLVYVLKYYKSVLINRLTQYIFTTALNSVNDSQVMIFLALGVNVCQLQKLDNLSSLQTAQ